MSNSDNNEDIIKSVKSIFKMNYNIPEYQRGYKWRIEQVLKLLKDIDGFNEENNKDKFYCLQNITIVKKNDYYDVIDGQQRLTTLFIILSYLQKYYKDEEIQLKNRLKYSIRKESEDFLYKYIFESDINYIKEKDSKYFYNENFDNKFDSQDVFHFALAKYTIIEFLKGKTDEEKIKFYKKLLENVIIIVNEVKSGNEENIFRNLNSNKVPLAEQDFIRAIFITRCKEDNKTEKISKRLKTGYDIDNMNIWWSKSSVYKYFNRFSKNYKGISLLYNLFFQCFKFKIDNKKYESLFDYLDNKNEKVNDTLKDILRFHNTMVDWYKDYEIYHLLGFISITKQNNIVNIWNKWEENISRDAFIKELKNIIEKELVNSFNYNNKNYLESYLSSITNINFNWYGMSKETIKLLVLMDIIKILKNEEKNFVRLPAEYFSKYNEDIEHIFSKTPNNETTIKEAKENIENIIKLVKGNKDTDRLNKFKNKIIKKEDTEKLNDIEFLEEYKQLILSIPIINSIGNLVLLNLSVNRGYGNSEYEIKRNKIVSLYESNNKYKYIRNHTWTIFTKSFYSNESKDLNDWTIKDIETTAKYIRYSIEDFFKDN